MMLMMFMMLMMLMMLMLGHDFLRLPKKYAKCINMLVSCWHIGFRTEETEHERSILMQVEDDRFEIIST